MIVINNKLIGKCPFCDNELKVQRLHCNKCNTSIEGNFSLNKFLTLTEEQLYFVEVFIKNKGSIKEVEKDLGISYPTVKNKLNNIITSLGYTDTKENSVDKKEILDQLNNGDISTEQALKLLKS